MENAKNPQHRAYNGHRNYNAWNIAVWLFNDEPLYRKMCVVVRGTTTLDKAAQHLRWCLAGEATPDGVPWTVTNIRLALRHWDGPRHHWDADTYFVKSL